MSLSDFITALKDLHAPIILLGASVLFILIALVGGGIQGVIQIPPISRGQRRAIGIIGVIFFLLGFILAAVPVPPTATATTPSGPTLTPTSPPTNNPTPTPAPTTPTPNPIWKVVLNRTSNTLAYNNYTVRDARGHHFLLVDASLEDVSSATQSLSGNLFDLRDEYGNHYSEDQASNPGQSFAVDPGQSIELVTAYVVPNSSCQFELSFIASSSVVGQWNIHSGYCS